VEVFYGEIGETEMNPDELQAGRELDALIAEKAMKESEFPHRWIGANDKTCIYCGHQEWEDEADKSCVIPSYSSDIAAAWLVAEKIGAHDAVTITRQTNGCRLSKQWSASAFFEMAEAETAPLAICRLALKLTLK